MRIDCFREESSRRLVPLTGIDLIKVWPGPFPGQQHAPGVLHSDGFDPGINKKEMGESRCFLPFLGAADRDRTGTLFRARDFKSLVSACSTTPAAIDYDNTIFLCRQVTAGPDSEHKHPDNCPGTSQAPVNS